MQYVAHNDTKNIKSIYTKKKKKTHLRGKGNQSLSCHEINNVADIPVLQAVN